MIELKEEVNKLFVDPMSYFPLASNTREMVNECS